MNLPDDETSWSRGPRPEQAAGSAGLGMWDWDVESGELRGDAGCRRMVGCSTEDGPRDDVFLLHPVDEARYRDRLQAHLDGTTAHFVCRHRLRRVDGRWIEVLDRGSISAWDTDGFPQRVSGVRVELAEDALGPVSGSGPDERREQMAMWVAELPKAAALLDVDLRYLSANARWFQEHGRDAEEVIGRTVRDVFPNMSPQRHGLLKRALNGEALHSDEDRVEGPDGRVRWLSWTLTPYRTVDGEVAGLVMMSDDITERVTSRMAREADARLASMAVVAGGAAHELSTPLHVIGLEASLIEEELRAEVVDPDALRVGVRAIVEAAARADAVVQTMRGLAPGEAAVTGPVQIGELVVETAGLMRELLRHRGIDLRVVLAGQGDTWVDVQADQIGQILVNLLTNAADAVESSPSRDRRWIQLEVSRAADRVHVRCIDGGPGVASDIAARMMEPFFTTKPVGEGTGLGLSLSHTLATRNRGSLRHLETAAQTTFELTLPVSNPVEETP